MRYSLSRMTQKHPSPLAWQARSLLSNRSNRRKGPMTRSFLAALVGASTLGCSPQSLSAVRDASVDRVAGDAPTHASDEAQMGRSASTSRAGVATGALDTVELVDQFGIAQAAPNLVGDTVILALY